jgi:hypothetical protein
MDVASKIITKSGRVIGIKDAYYKPNVILENGVLSCI